MLSWEIENHLISVIAYGALVDRCLHLALPARHLLQMSTKHVTTRATTASRAGCVRHGMGHVTPFSWRRSRNAAEDEPRTNILQLNTEGLLQTRSPSLSS